MLIFAVAVVTTLVAVDVLDLLNKPRVVS